MGGDTTKDIHATWRGLRVRFCCAGCEEEFYANPEERLRAIGVDPDALGLDPDAAPSKRASVAGMEEG